MLSRSIILLQLDQVAAAVADAAGPGGSSAAASSGAILIFSRGQVQKSRRTVVDVPTVIPKSPRKLESRSLSVFSSDSEAKHLYEEVKELPRSFNAPLSATSTTASEMSRRYGELLGKNCKHKIK
jgi:hypothetical protein